MRVLSLLRLGLRSARRHPILAVLFYLAALLPALLILSLLAADLGPVLGRSLAARGLLEGETLAVLGDFVSSEASDLGPVVAGLPLRVLLVTLLHLLVTAGAVEVLLERSRRHDHPFLLGVGDHTWRYLRSAIWFLLALVPLAGVTAALLYGGTNLAEGRGDGRLEILTWIVTAVVSFVLYAFLDLAYDLSRISAAAHGDSRTFVGLFAALGFVLKRPFVLFPLYLIFAVLTVGPVVGYAALRPLWRVDTAWEVVGLVLAQQGLYLLVAFLRVAFWGAEIAYFQGVGEPRWCGSGSSLVRAAPAAASRDGSSAPPAADSAPRRTADT